MKTLLKQVFLAAAISFSVATVSAQEVKVKYSMNSNNYGLYNERTSRWVTSDHYGEGVLLCSYNGLYYYALKNNAVWEVFNEKGTKVIDRSFDGINSYAANGFFPFKLNGSWGIMDTFGHVIIANKYKDIYVSDNRATLYPWDGNAQGIRMDELVAKRTELVNQEKIDAENKTKAEKERLEREKKERALASFTEYARSFVEPRINQWQNKGEFEKMADFQKRVTGPNRTAMIDSLTRVAEHNFIEEHAALKPENALMTLDVYDSENEVFFIESAKLGKMVVPVPISEGPDFKAHFSSLERKNPVFYIDQDKLALASLDFYDKMTNKTYHFNNDSALNYNHYDIDPDTFKFELVNIVTAKPVALNPGSSAVVPQRPSITILSPAKNATYSDPRVTVRYQASVYDGSTPVLHAWINGMETEVMPKSQSNPKGVAAGWDEVEFILPKDPEHLCNIMLSITDGSGYSSENKTVSLKYIGDLPKPKLHLFAVGISNYSSPSLTRLEYAAKDASDFVSTISSSDVSMYEQVVTPTILTDGNATKSNIERGLASLARDVEQDDVVMLFFSGHGALDGDDAYYLSVDAVSGDPYTGVDFSLIRKNMTKIKDKKCRVLIFMDTCYSGAMFNAKSDLKSITFADHDIIGFYSSTASQTSAEFSKDENGLFTKALLAGLKGGAKNQDDEITTGGLQKYVSDYVNKQTSGKQSPIVENKVGDVVLYKIK